jgi:hypothetical protein
LFVDDYLYRMVQDGSDLTLLNPGTDNKFKGSGLYIAAADDKQTIYVFSPGTFWTIRRFNPGSTGSGFDVIQDAILNNSWGLAYNQDGNTLYTGNGTGAQISQMPASPDAQSAGAITNIAIPPVGVDLMTFDNVGNRLFFAGEDVPYWAGATLPTLYAGPLAADIGAHAIAKVQVIQ